MKKYSFKKTIALILCAALIFQSTSLTYAVPPETGEISLTDDESYEASAEATTETAIKISDKTAVKASTESAIKLDIQEDDYDISWYADEEDNFEIKTANQLRGLAHLVNGTAVTSGTAIEAKDFDGKTITIGNNIDLENEEWVPIGMSNAFKFKGHFDGKNFTVSNLYINTEGTYLGLFGYIDSSAEIKNMTVQGIVTETSPQGYGSTYVGGIVGYVNGDAKLTNLTNFSNVTMSRNYAGGIAGYVNGSAVITNCYNYGKISAHQYAGGIAGGSTGTISESTNYGDITDIAGYSAGIAANVSAGKIEDCSNEGNISGANISGGIVSSLGAGTVNRCTNKGIVELKVNSAGGISGNFNGAGKITNCINEGKVYMTGVGTDAYIGGILGSSSYWSSGIVTGNKNTGTIGGVSFTGRAGGIIGGGTGSVKVENNCNTGSMLYADGMYIGGIAGDLPASDIKNSFSYYLNGNEAEFGLLGTGSNGTVTNSFYLSNKKIAEFKGLAKNADAFRCGEVLYYINGMSEHGTTWKQGTLYPEVAMDGDSVFPVYQVRLVPIMAGYEGIEAAFSDEFQGMVIDDASNGSKNVYVNSGTEVGFTINHATENIGVAITGVTPVPSIDPAKSINKTLIVSEDDIKIVYTLGDADSNADISWYSDDMVSFALSTPGELNGFAYLVNSGKDFNGKTVILSDNIDVSGIGSWTPAGNQENPFMGTFNGNGKTVSGLIIGTASNPINSDYQGFFGYNAGSVSNLRVEGEIYSTGRYIGGVVGYSAGTLNGLTFVGKVAATGDLSDFVGGVVGYSTGAIGASAGLVFGNISELTDNKVTNPSSIVTGHDYVGGIAGYSTGAVNSSKNYGEVTGASRAGGVAGGAVSTVTANTNYAPVNVSGDYAGGIVGHHSEDAAVSSNINYGDVKSDGSYAGGILGAIRGTTAAANNTNNGDVTASGDYAGGIAGSASNKDADTGATGAAITTSVNNGVIIGRDYVGGIVGLYRSTLALHTASNNGVVSGGSYVGGIAGAAYGPLGNNSLATNVKNTASVTGKGNYIGGLGGYLKSVAASVRTVSYGYNIASVNGSETSSYVGGIMGRGDGAVEYTYAAGESGTITVTGGANVGGLVGYIDKNIAISYSYACADVTGVEKLAGGVKPGVNIIYTNSYYLTEAGNEEDTKAKTADSFASGEVAWLLGGGDGIRNTTWSQEKGKLPTLVSNKPVFKANIIKGIAPEGSSVTITEGSFGMPGETDGNGRQWVYVISGEKLKVTTVTPGVAPDAVYGISFINPLEVSRISSADDKEKTTSVYSVGPITSNYDGQYIIDTDIEPDYKWYDENSGATEFIISNEYELKGLAYLVNGLRSQSQPAMTFSDKSIKLNGDITITGGNWTPVGTSSTPFQGTFNGTNHKVSGLNISSAGANQGLFGYISGSAKIENLTVLDADILSTGTATGGIVGTAAGSSTLYNLVFGAPDDNSVINGQSQSGGIVGNIAANTVKIDKCINYGFITGTLNVGGIVGQTGASANINGCKNEGNITGTSNTGGIAGLTGAGSGALYNRIETCSNSGKITGESGIGGIVGLAGNYTNFGRENDSSGEYACVNSGEISGETVSTIRAANAGVGGIAGQAGSNVNFYNNSNSGKINGEFSFSGAANTTVSGVGGIAGITGTFAKFYKNENIGIIAGNISNTESNAIAGIGGIVGRTNSSAELTESMNSGEIGGYIGSSGLNSIAGMGGLAGVISANQMIGTATNAKINGCINTGIVGGDVTGTGGTGIGGVSGVVSSGSDIVKCINQGTVKGINIVGGITGQTGNNTKHIGCSNEGEVQASGKVCAGGIAGNIGSGSSVENSYNTGSIIVTDAPVIVTGVGGITGINGSSNSFVKNSYSVGYVKVTGVGSAVAVGGITGSYSTGNSNNYFYRHNVFTGKTEADLSVPAETGDEIISGHNMPIQEGAYKSGELAWRLDMGHTSKRLNIWAQDTVLECPTLDTAKYKIVYRLLVEDADHGNITPSCSYLPAGNAVILKITPDTDYTIRALGLKGNDGKYYVPIFSDENKTATLTMPETSLIASPAFMLSSEIKGGSYQITFDLNGGIGSADLQSVNAGDRAVQPETDPTRDGFIFMGWYDKKVVGEEGNDFFGADIFDFSTRITEDTNLIACWRPENSMIVMFDLNRDQGAVGSEPLPVQIVKFNGKIKEPEAPTWKTEKEADGIKKEYNFDGWYTEPKNGSEWKFEDVLQEPKDGNYVLTLYAHWEKKIIIPDDYAFNNIEDLIALGISVKGNDYSGYKFTLGADITLPENWEGIGQVTDGGELSSGAFNGEFDGNGHTVYLNPYVTNPLFQEIGPDGYVHHVNAVGDLAGVNREIFGCIASINSGTIDSCTTTLTGGGDVFGQTCGGIAGTNTGGTVTNCVAKINIEFSGRYCGGIVGTSTDGVIENCILKGTSQLNSISSYNAGLQIGGIIGNAVRTNVMECTVEKGVIMKFPVVGQARGGGIIGEFTGSKSETYIISDCTNYADLESTLTAYMAGIVGNLVGTIGETEGIKIIDCENYGNITGGGNGIGGILGRVDFSLGQAHTMRNLEIENCFNYGYISNVSKSNNQSDAGGIIGRIYNGSGTNTTLNASLKNCGNEGKISSVFQYAGGLIGWIQVGTITIDSSYNKGVVTGIDNGIAACQTGGGLIGNVENNALTSVEINECRVMGDIEGFTTNAGGFIGNVGSLPSLKIDTNVKIKKSYFEGNFKNGSAGTITGGIIGNLASTTVNVEATDVYWKGSFENSTPNTFGGVLGSIGSSAGSVSLTNAYWYGDGRVSPGLIGRVTDATNVSVSNAYYRLDTPEYAYDDAFGVGKPQEAFTSGEVAYLIDGGNSDGSNGVRSEDWTQDFEKGYPVLEEGKPVYMITMNNIEGNGTVGIRDRGSVASEDNKPLYFGIDGKTVKINAVPQEVKGKTNKLKSLIVTNPDDEEIQKFDVSNNSESTEYEFTIQDSNIKVNAVFDVQETVTIKPNITGYSEGAVMIIGSAESGKEYVAYIGEMVRVSVDILTHPGVDGAESAEYYLKSLTVEFEDGSTMDIAGIGHFEATGNAVVTAVIGEKIGFPPVEESDDEDNDDETQTDDKNIENGGDEDGDGIGNGTGAGIGEGTGGGTDIGTGEKQTGMSETGSGIPVESSTDNKKDDASASSDTSQQPQNKEVVSVKTDEKSEEEQTPPDQEDKKPETPEEPEKEEPEEEAEEASVTPAESNQKNIIPPIAAAILAVMLILVGIYRFIILKKKQ